MAKSKKYNGYLRKRFTINGKQYTVYGKTNDELYQKETEKRKQIEQGLNELYNPTLAQYYDHFTEIRKKEVKESTIRSQASQFKIASSGVVAKGITLGKMPIKEIKRKDIEKARQDLLKKNKTPQNLNNIFAHLNHVFNNAVLDDTIVKNPCKALPPLKRNTPLIGENKHRALTPEELKAFFEESASRNSYYDNLFKVMAKTGMRVGEVCALLPKDIDRKKGFIHVTRTVTRSETGSYMLGEDAKTKSGKRDIPLTNELVTIFEDQRRFNEAFFGITIDELEKPIFRSVEGKILREYTINREIKRICKDAEIEKFTCHCFRNTYATMFIQQRPQDYKILSELLGHKDIKITLNLYTHVMSDSKIEAMNSVVIAI